jgi:hypothetical protein
MMNEADFLAANKYMDFVALNEHLKEVRPIFDDFCARHGFAYVARTAIGRYPRIRIARERLTSLYFDLWMDFDEKGQRFEQFRRDLPYSLYAGASIIEADGSKHGIRFQKDITCFSGKPFDQVGAVLQSEMEKHLPTLEGWDAQYLKNNGEKVQLGT